MTETSILFTCKVIPTNDSSATPLRLSISVNDTVLWSQAVDQVQTLSIPLPDVDGNYLMCFKLEGKTSEHTKVDEQGNILLDHTLEITDLAFEDIDVTQLISELSEYKHSYNGNGAKVTDRFFGTLGCNGTVTFTYKSPFYLWMLENL